MKLWIFISSMCVASGWLLSAIGQLNERGYFAVCIFFTIWSFFCFRRSLWGVIPPLGGISFKKSLRRFRRPLPFLFLLLALLAFIGGAIYPPSNYDGLTYRVPRVLNWLAENRWHWIDSSNVRFNDRSCGFEWIMAPLLLFTGSDRPLFLINVVSFLLLPGLIFSVFTKLGVRSRVAWFWMWLLPTGYNFVLQAGSIGNDTFATAYALAAVHFALQARESKKISDLWFSILAAGLLTGSKPGNLPLLLPWFIAIFPSFRLVSFRPISTLAVTICAALVSFLPTAVLNWINCGDWTGMVLEPRLVMKQPDVGILGNVFLSLLENLTPPLFPFATWWNQHGSALLPDRFFTLLEANFEPGYLRLGELQIEEAAGVGFGLCCLLLVTWIAVLIKQPKRKGFGNDRWRAAIRWSSYVSLAVLFVKSGMIAIARIMSVYYVFLFLPLLVGRTQVAITRQKWWQYLAIMVSTSAVFVLVVTPARPLWPVHTVLAQIKKSRPESPVVKRAEKVYSVYSVRNDLFAPFRLYLPPDPIQLGLIAGLDDAETSLWRPFGSRRVIHLTGPKRKDPMLEWIVLKTEIIEQEDGSLNSWLVKNSYEVAFKTNITAKIIEGPKEWCLARRLGRHL